MNTAYFSIRRHLFKEISWFYHLRLGIFYPFVPKSSLPLLCVLGSRRTRNASLLSLWLLLIFCNPIEPSFLPVKIHKLISLLRTITSSLSYYAYSHTPPVTTRYEWLFVVPTVVANSFCCALEITSSSSGTLKCTMGCGQSLTTVKQESIDRRSASGMLENLVHEEFDKGVLE